MAEALAFIPSQCQLLLDVFLGCFWKINRRKCSVYLCRKMVNTGTDELYNETLGHLKLFASSRLCSEMSFGAAVVLSVCSPAFASSPTAWAHRPSQPWLGSKRYPLALLFLPSPGLHGGSVRFLGSLILCLHVSTTVSALWVWKPGTLESPLLIHQLCSSLTNCLNFLSLLLLQRMGKIMLPTLICLLRALN